MLNCPNPWETTRGPLPARDGPLAQQQRDLMSAGTFLGQQAGQLQRS